MSRDTHRSLLDNISGSNGDEYEDTFWNVASCNSFGSLFYDVFSATRLYSVDVQCSVLEINGRFKVAYYLYHQSDE